MASPILPGLCGTAPRDREQGHRTREPELREPVIPAAGAQAHNGRPRNPVDLRSMEVASVVPVAPELARAMGYPGFSEDEGRRLSPRELKEAVRAMAARALNTSFDSAASSVPRCRRRADDVRLRFDRGSGTHGGDFNPALVARVLSTHDQPGFAGSMCQITAYQQRDIEF